MASRIDQGRTIAALRAVWSSIDALVDGLADEQWRAPTPLPAWDVQANVAHVLGTEAFLLGERPSAAIDADALDHVRNPIGSMNENWVASMAGRTRR